jgi:hypothetical protein
MVWDGKLLCGLFGFEPDVLAAAVTEGFVFRVAAAQS